MALNFPSSPSINDTYTYGDKTWVWNGRFWQIQAAGAINDIAIGNITPNTGAFTTLTATGNITAQGNVQGQYILGNGAFLTGISGSSTYGNANVANYLPNYGGNISTNVVSGNFYANSILPWSPTAGLINDAVDIGNSTLYFKDIYVGNVITPAGDQGNATQIQPASGAGQSGVAFVDAITGSASDVSAGTLYVESIDAIGNVTVDTFVEANEIIALSNVSGTGGNFSGNVSASYFLGNGAFLTGIAAGYSNANVANYLPNYQGLVSNIDFRSTSPAAVAMVVTDRPITIGGNTLSYVTIPNDGNANSVAAELTNHGLGNVLISSGPDDHEWIFDNTGNLTAPGNIQAGNAVSANYFLGNGALLTGIITNYSNANVANYLATYNGNALFSNVTVSRDAVILGNLRVEGNTTYINVNDLVVDDYLVIIGNAATQVSDLNGAGLQIGNLANSNIQFVYDYTSNVMTLNRGANIANVLNVSGNVTGNYFIGNGALLTGIVTSSYSNANVANYLPTYTGNVTAGNISVTGNVTANWFVGNINTTNSLVTSGNVTANNFIGSDPNVNLIAGSYTWAFNDAGNLVLPSNTFAVNYANGVQVSLGGSYSNADVANYLASNANVTITVGVSNITTQGNISGNYFIGNGALLTGVVTSSYSNANVANYLPTYTGNITAGNIAVTGNVTANWFVGNINTTNSLVTSGNITANNFIGSDPNVGLVAGNYTWLFDNAGNVTLPSNTFAVNYANGTAVSLGGTYSNADVANYLPTYNGNALFSNITVSRDAVILGNLRVEGNTTYINVSDLIVEDKDIIVAANANATMTDLNGAGLQIGNRSAGGNITFFYNSTSNVMTLSHGANIANVLNVAGNITATGNVNTGNLVGSGTNVEIVGGSYTWTFNGSGNLVLPGNTFAVNYANGTQVALAGSYSNTNVKAYLGNFDGNIIPSANVTYDLGSNSNRWNDLYLNNSTIYIGAQEITANADSTIFSGNIAVGNLVGTGDNVDIKAGAYTWRFDNAGNLTLPANTSAINYANGATVPVGYGNASVAAYLGSNANLTILSQGNITGNYFIGNGALLTGVVTSSYSNANVANYLPTYTGNIAAGNVTATGNVQGAYILGNGALLTGLPATYGNSNVAAYLASNANVTLAIGTGNITTQGNLAVGNLIGSGDNVDLKAGSYTWRFDSTGNLTLPANSTAIYYANGTQVPVGYGNANVASYLSSNSAVTILTTANITTAANISGAYILGNGALLTGLSATYGNSNVAAYLAVYNGNALFSNITVSQDAVVLGNLRVEGNTTYINVSDLIVEDKDIIVAANASATMTDLNGAGLQIGNRTAGGNITFFYNSTSNVMSLSHGANISNVLNVSGNISATGNVSGNWFVGNVNTTNSLVTSGNVTANNFVGSGNNVTLASDSYSWIFDNAGNLTLPGNTFAVNYANGTQISLGGSYSNSIVANYLASNANLTISVGTGNITTQGNITGNYFIGNGALLTGVVTSSYSNANVANYLPTFTGNVGAGNLNITGNIIDTGALNIITGASGNITLAPGNSNVLIVRTTGANITGTLGVTGNVDAGNLNITGNIVDTGALTIITGASGNITLAPGNTSVLIARTTGANITGTLGVTGNITGGNITTTIVSATGNVSGGNITTTGVVTATGNITGGNIVTTGIVSATGNVNASNLNITGNIVDTGELNIITGASGNVSLAPGNTSVLVATTTGVNVAGTLNTTGSFITAGNVTANNLIGTGVNTSIVSNNYTWTFNSEGNLVLPGNTFAVNYANGTAVSLGGSSSYGNTNVAAYLQAYNGNALFSNVTVSRDVLILGNLRVEGNTTEINVSNIFLEDKDIIVAANANATLSDLNGAGLQIGNRTAGGNITFFYNSISNVMSLSHGANIANVLNVDGNIVATGNVTGNYILGNGAFLTGLPATYGNSNVAAYLASNANITLTIGTGNITTQGNVAVGNLIGSGNNVEITAGVYTWTLDNTGNLTLPGNTTAINYANGTPVPVGYGNANVATYLASNANVTVSVGISNITTQGNISGNYFIGNGALLTGVVTSSYSNANVANYLPTYTGNVSAGNLNLTGNIVDTGAIFVITGANGNVILAPNGTSRIIATTSGANVIGNLDVAGNVNANGATLTGNLSVGNLIGSGDNVEITAGAYTWTLDNTGNLILPGNTTAIYYANGTQVPVGYGNANVATYLASNAAVTILTTANITTAANISGAYILGNGAFLSGLPATYGNSNVAAYLAAYNGNALFSNITVSQDAVILGNLRVEGNTTYINVTDLIVEDKDIIVAANANATLTDLNGAGLQIGNRSAGGNITFFYNSTSNVMSLSHGANIANILNVAGNVTATGNVNTGNLVGSGTNVEIVSGAYTWLFDGAGNLTGTGNVSAGNFVGTSGNTSIVTANYTWTFNDAGNLVLPGNTFGVTYANGTTVSLGGSYSNADVANYLASNANLTISVGTGNITTQGNVSGNYFIGNGALLTGVVTSSYSNANVANYLPTYTGNITAGNITTTGNVTGNWFVGNVNTTNSLVTSGNVTANNFVGSSGNTSIVTAAYTWVFNDTGNFVLPGNSFSVNYANGAQVSLGGSYSNADVKSYLGNFDGNIIPSANVTYNLGSNSNRWNDLYLNNSTIYIGAQEITANANATIFSGNISANYILGNGALLTGVASSYGNANVADYLASNANINLAIGTGNITTQGNISVGSIQGANANTTIVANIYTWTFDDTGNLTLPGNSTAIYLANGTQVPIGYDNSMVASYLASNAAVTILTTANITTQGNITGNYFIGNGALLTGVVTSSYSNANVANYLPTYNANALFSNITVSRDAVVLGNLRVEGNTTYINVSDLVIEDKDIIVAANASATMTDLNGAGLQIGNRSAGGNITFFYNSTSNVMSLSHGANIANVLNVAGNITANSLVGVGTNVELVGGSYTWTFNGSGNLVLPGNTFAVNYANGAQVSLGGSYSNAEVASYLASNANVTILTGVANITTQGNVTAGYFLGNATFAEGVSNTYFGNVSPSSPAQGDIWINSDTAVQLIYFVDANGGQWAEMAAATSISSDSDYSDSNVIALLSNLGGNTISSSANITTSANISAGYILGNGSQLTGLNFTNYTNSNVANYLVSYNANALFSNVTVSRDMVIIGNLRVDGNTTEINVSNIFLEDKDIIVAANGNATLSDLDGAGLQIGNITAGGNITFFYNSTSNVMSLSHGANIANVLNVAGNISAANITATGNITGNTNGFTIGYRDVPQVSWSNATMALADASKHYYTSTGGVTLTVPSNANVAFPIGATIAFYNRSSANCTIAPQASVNIFVVGNSTITPTANRTITSNGGGTLTKVDTNTWMLSAANVV